MNAFSLYVVPLSAGLFREKVFILREVSTKGMLKSIIFTL